MLLGPSRKQVLIDFALPKPPPADSSLLLDIITKSLATHRASVKAESISQACIHDFFPDELGNKIWVGLLASKSCLWVLDVPTEQSNRAGPTLPDHLRQAMYASALTKYLHLDRPVCLICNSKTSKRACEHIAIFTDSIAMAKRALDPSLHSLQSHSLLTCKLLEAWLAEDPLQWISFHHVPSKLKWGMQYEAHQHAAGAYHRPVDHSSQVTLNRLCMEADSNAAQHWAKAATDCPQDLGHDFLQLRKLRKKVVTITPDICKGGPWIHKDNTSFACLCRCILNHAPIGSYYRQFNIEESHGCLQCGAPHKTCLHILLYCPGYKRPAPMLYFTSTYILHMDSMWEQILQWTPSGLHLESKTHLF
ncbi:hypothetical protein GALMADRAFT_139347 [Galerina marginata CBS 339.88]|uniref:Uncharacterized protein n=1 Tax=Galerina marginata (strain CBS 339.88) TaxID=685588 RepID=A0A067TBU4_GALM3|nr:hypothetical protein GALMADRAFT_139347 [Galerina marginata CBS 339.88]